MIAGTGEEAIGRSQPSRAALSPVPAPIAGVAVGQCTSESHAVSATVMPAQPFQAPSHKVLQMQIANDTIRYFSTSLDDLESARIASENRERAMRYQCATCGWAHSAKEMKAMGAVFHCTQCGGGSSMFDMGVGVVELASQLLDLERQITKQLERAMKQHPLGPAMANMVGVGFKQGARLIAAIGDPYWFVDRPRTVSQLWAYSGLHVLPAGDHATDDTQIRSVVSGQPSATPTDQTGIDTHSTDVGGVAPKLQKGQRANWNSTARMRAILVAESCIKAKNHPSSKYGPLYDAARAHEAERVHDTSCAQCGVCESCGNPPGASKPLHFEQTGCATRKVAHARPGDPLRLGHQHARARRKVAKAVLLDLWLAGRDWYQEG